jgi:hypothetical protein
MLRCAQDDTRGSNMGDIRGTLQAQQDSPPLVMLSAAKHLGAPRDRCFAALSMTPGEAAGGTRGEADRSFAAFSMTPGEADRPFAEFTLRAANVLRVTRVGT